MKNSQIKFKIGNAIKVKGKIYLVLDITANRIICRKFEFTKAGRFKYYQDYNFPIVACNLANRQEEKLINEQKMQAILQRSTYSAIRETCCEYLIR